ncbi:hypothetical protein CYMTET_51744 [Cymbomonas tetramitiformis]|uniref:Uncharacterized protein n=1 Tax=Cymbomonas tetramitiformis TaxID=36881 RepID=A0AAE0BKF4_9CHLO|nr:hypothetical protein CYMTET_51744 [Cymbomonas tetramitiformis]
MSETVVRTECPLCPGHFHDTARCPEVCGSCDVELRDAAMDLDEVVSAFQTAFDNENDEEFADLCHEHDQPLVRTDPEPFTYPVVCDAPPPANHKIDTMLYPVSASDPASFGSPFEEPLHVSFMDRVMPTCPDTSLKLCSIDSVHESIHPGELSVIDDDNDSDGFSYSGDEIPSAPPATRSRVGLNSDFYFSEFLILLYESSPASGFWSWLLDYGSGFWFWTLVSGLWFWIMTSGLWFWLDIFDADNFFNSGELCNFVDHFESG